MIHTYTETTVLETITCCNCGILFATPQHWKQERVNNGGTFYCPNGHSQVYSEPTVVKLRRELEEKARALTAAKCYALREQQQREAAEKKLRRVSNGVCPCCNRSFQNLARHMKTKHPKHPQPRSNE